MKRQIIIFTFFILLTTQLQCKENKRQLTPPQSISACTEQSKTIPEHITRLAEMAHKNTTKPLIKSIKKHPCKWAIFTYYAAAITAVITSGVYLFCDFKKRLN